MIMQADANEIGLDQEMKAGIAEESKEHTWLTSAQIKRLVSDHLAMDPEYYEEEDKD